MDNKYETNEITELLRSFVEYKDAIPYLNSYVGAVKEVEQLNIETNYEESTKTVEVKLIISCTKGFWLLDDFINLKKYLDNRYPRELVIMGDEDSWSNKKWILQKVNDIVQINELDFSIKGAITLHSSQELSLLINKDFRKQDISEMFKIKFLNRVSSTLRNDELISENVQKILLNQEKIKEVKIEDIQSGYFGILDKFQKDAFRAAISNNDILIIKGPPGTGKSRVISQLLKHYTLEKKQVIIASQTHAALDNVIENISVTSTTQNYTGILWEKTSKGNANQEYALATKMLSRNIRDRLLAFSKEGLELEKLLQTSHTGVRTLNRYIPKKLKWMSNVLFTTLASRGLENIQEVSPKAFKNSILIIDEVSKLSIVDVLRFSMHARKVILFGDDMQLPPIKDERMNTNDFKEHITDRELEVYKHLFEDSIFYKMFQEGFKQNIILKNTYRSPEYILNLYNDFFYKGLISSKVDDSSKLIQFKDEDSKLGKAYSKDLILVDSKLNDFTLEEYRQKEINTLMKHLEFLNNNVSDKSRLTVMILFHYKKQKNYFTAEKTKDIIRYKKNFGSFKFGTIDQMQGQEAEVVYILTSKSSAGQYLNTSTYKYINLLQTMQRINVALSRSKNKIILFSDINYLSELEIWDAITLKKTPYRWKEILHRFEARIKDGNNE